MAATRGKTGQTVARRPQAERRATTRDRLLTAAVELIVERGIAGTSLAEIGRRAGYSHAIVNHHFGSKTALVEEVAARVEHTFTAQYAALGSFPDGLTAVLQLVDMYVDLVGDPHSPSHANLVLWTEAIVHEPDLREHRALSDERVRAGIAGFITAGIEDGTIRPGTDAKGTALVILGMLRGVLLQSTLDERVGNPKRLRRTLRAAITQMIATDGEP